ncbi:flagellar type III secretion system pore protein FliP [Candidatus Latescibacterota bacterium]
MGHKLFVVVIAIVMLAGTVNYACAQDLPGLSLQVGSSDTPENVAVTVQIILLITVLSLAPAFLILLTSFTRIIIVLSFLRHALSTQQMPPNQVLIGLALFMTFFIMSPVFNEINEQAIRPYLNQEIEQRDAFDRAVVPLRVFMFKHARQKDIALFIRAGGYSQPANETEVPTLVLIPAFVISELRTAFQMGFMLFLPFLIIDMVVASVLMSMGMMMLPPIMISLPFKILLFVLADGWHVLIQSLILSFQ